MREQKNVGHQSAEKGRRAAGKRFACCDFDLFFSEGHLNELLINFMGNFDESRFLWKSYEKKWTESLEAFGDCSHG